MYATHFVFCQHEIYCAHTVVPLPYKDMRINNKRHIGMLQPGLHGQYDIELSWCLHLHNPVASIASYLNFINLLHSLLFHFLSAKLLVLVCQGRQCTTSFLLIR